MSNCLLSVSLFGSKRVTATKVSFGMSLSSIQAEGRSSKVMHSTNLQGSGFTVDLIFKNHREYASTMDWLARYIRWIASADGNMSPVRVVIPARNLDKVGVLTSGVTFGDRVGALTYSASLKFDGAEDTQGRISWVELLREQFHTPVEGTVAPYLPASNAGPQLYGWDDVSNDVGFDYGEGRVY